MRIDSPRGSRSVARPLLALLRCLALTAFAAQACAQDALRHFDIPTQDAALSLKEFARQADITLVFSSAAVAQHQTPGIRGDFTVMDALRHLLDGTGLSFKQVSTATIAISPASEPDNSPDPPPPKGADQPKEAPQGESTMNHRGFLTRLAGLFALGGALATGGPAHAQATAADAAAPASAATDQSAADTNNLQEVVVTATGTGRRKLDASYTITTASLEEIRDSSPSSAADLLKIVPGVWAESSAGQAGANIELAGFPGGSDSPYVSFAINGAPLFPSSGNISFMDNSSLFRIDESIERAEVVQGGPAVVFANGQLGATANFILRQGTPVASGDIGITYGDEGLYRVDGFYGGPLTQDWFMSIGGFYRYSNGVRDSQFPADNGGQLTATLSHTWDTGKIMFFARALNDKNLFITDIPVTVSGTGTGQSVSAFPGFNPNTGTFAGSGLRGISVQEAPGAPPVNGDLADGRGADLHMFGSNLDLDLSDRISLSNNMMYNAGTVNCYCLFNNLAPQTLGSFIDQEIASTNAAIGGTINPATGKLIPFATAGTATLVGSTAALNPNMYVASLGFWMVQKQIQSFTDELRFNFQLVPGNTLTTGAYFAAYSSNDQWYLGNNELVTATPNASLIDLTLNNGANITSNAGLLGASFFTLNERWNGLNTALFLSDSWKLGPWLFDAGYRIETQRDHGTIENDTATDLDNNALNRYNKGVSVANGTYTSNVSCETSGSNECTEYNHTLGSWTLGANYELNSSMAVFGRINHGVHFPGFDDLRSGTPQSQSIQNYELGFRGQTGSLYVVADVFRRKFDGVPFQQFTEAGQNITASYGASSYGVELQSRWEPIEHLTFDFSGNWQHAVYTNWSSAGSSGFDFTGTVLQRQPRLQFRITPGYEVPTGWGGVRVFATYSYVGLRYSNPGEEEVLPQYYTLDAGIVGTIGSHFEVRVQGTNLTNQLGLTEGNARIAIGSGSGVSNDFEMARPIFGREVNIQLRYKF